MRYWHEVGLSLVVLIILYQCVGVWRWVELHISISLSRPVGLGHNVTPVSNTWDTLMTLAVLDLAKKLRETPPP